MGKNTYVAVGNREDVSELITNIAPDETPFYTMCGSGGKAAATYHEWLEDTLRAPGTNQQIEGFEYTVADPVPRVRLGNYTQIFSVGYGVTETQEVVLKHGLGSEIGYQMQKAMKEIALDVESALITQTAPEPGSATTARVMGGVPGWITTNATNVGGALTEEALNDSLQACWQAGGNPKRVFLSGGQKRVVSQWTEGFSKEMMKSDKRLVSSISVYESDFGVVSFTPHRMMTDDTLLVIDPQFWKVAYLRSMKSLDLPKTGDMRKKVIVGELTLEARAEKASAILTGLTA